MLAARGVSLGLGKINLSDLNQLPADRAFIGRVQRLRKKQQAAEPRLVVHKQVDRKTLWQACRFVVAGTIIITLGLVMTVVGYFDRQFSTTTMLNGTFGANVEVVNHALRYQLKSMQYVGPIFMGFGTFCLILACVLTLESRDRHTETIQEESAELRRSKKRDAQSAAAKTTAVVINEETGKAPRDKEIEIRERLPEQRPNENATVQVADEFAHSSGQWSSPTGSRRETFIRKDIVAEVHEEPGPSDIEMRPLRPPQRSRHVPKNVSAPDMSTIVDRPQLHSPSFLSHSTAFFDDRPTAHSEAPKFLNVHTRRPRGPAPLAHVDSVLDLPTLSATASRSSSNASSKR